MHNHQIPATMRALRCDRIAEGQGELLSKPSKSSRIAISPGIERYA
jgi:hypothetical protein